MSYDFILIITVKKEILVLGCACNMCFTYGKMVKHSIQTSPQGIVEEICSKDPILDVYTRNDVIYKQTCEPS